MLANPWLKYVNSRDNGYMVLDVYADRVVASVFTVDRMDPNSAKKLSCRFRYSSGRLERLA